MDWWNLAEGWSSCSKMNPNHVLIGLVTCEMKTVCVWCMVFTKAMSQKHGFPHCTATISNVLCVLLAFLLWCLVAATLPIQVLGICPRRCPGHHRKDPQHCCQDLPSNFRGWRSARVNWSLIAGLILGETNIYQHSFFIPWSFSSWVHIEVRTKFCFFRMSTLCHQHQSRFPPRNFQEYPQYPLLKLFCTPQAPSSSIEIRCFRVEVLYIYILYTAS